MKYGLIGGKLGHSFSKEIHARLADYEYELKELPPEGVDELMTSKDFCAVNVTIPYKERVLPFMEQIDEGARRIGSVNTVVNRDGRLCGYNTDYMGMRSLILRHCGGLDGKSVLILGGDGGTARTAYAVATDLGAKAVYRVSRSAKDGFIDYPTALTVDADVIINTTPVGMFPDTDGMPIDVKAFPHLSLVIDAVYNPLRTPLVLAAQEMGIPAEGGLYMLVSQAVYACTHFTGREFGEETFRTVFAKTRSEKENIVLIGMPGCGKSTVGRMLAERLGRQFIDLDEVIVNTAGKTIPEIFSEAGEAGFRDIESEVVRKVTKTVRGAVIATGGGAILRRENVRELKKDGKLYFLDCPLEKLLPTADRPLANSAESIRSRYEERYALYLAAADKTVASDHNAIHTATTIEEDFLS